MSTSVKITCDICTTEKQLVNHWFVAYSERGGDETPPKIIITPWEMMSIKKADLCGEECLLKWINQNLSKLKREESEKVK